MQSELLPHFDYLGTSLVKCKACGQEMDTRGGRAKKHLSETHAVTILGKPKPERKADKEERVAEVSEVASVTEPSAFARGSREWAVEKVLAVADDSASTSEQKLKALDLLKEYQDFGTKRLDDEKEAEQSRLQWDRVFDRTKDLKRQEDELLKDPSVRVRLKEALERVK